MKITVNNASYRNTNVHNQTFELVQDIKRGSNGHFVTVLPNTEIGHGRDKIRINVSPENVIYPAGFVSPTMASMARTDDSLLFGDGQASEETDEEVMIRIADRFDVLEEMTAACIDSKIRGVIVVGPPGVGKSYGVFKQLEESISTVETFNQLALDKQELPKYAEVKGATTALGLYMTLYNHSSEGEVIVFDDCDSILQEELALNLLKAALDSGKKRKLCWNSDSSLLKSEGIPKSFEFKGSIIFITNINFDNIKSKKIKEHLDALQSRCHYLDLAMNSMRDRMLRIKQIHMTGALFSNYGFAEGEGDEIVAYMEQNVNRLREVSLRMAIKLADLVNVSVKWKRLAESTVIKTGSL